MGEGTYTFRILGCGSSPGVPRVGPGPGGDWGVCDPTNPKNRRRRSALLVTRTGADGRATRVLIDAGPDLREQALDAGLDWVDGVLVTHPHADHVHGIDDLRAFVHNRRRLVDIYMDEPTALHVEAAFGYCFVTPPGSKYPPILRAHRLEPGEPVAIDGPGGPIEALPIRVRHGEIDSLAFRIAGVCYCPDVSDIPETSVADFLGLDWLVLDALRWTRHPSHISVAEALDWIARLRPARAILTHMHIDVDHAVLAAHVPEGVVPAHDGLEWSVPA